MQLLTKEIEKKLQKSPYDLVRDKCPAVPIICKFFTPFSSWTWYVYAGNEFQNQITNQSDWELRAWVEGNYNEDGPVLLSSLQKLTIFTGLTEVPAVERDRHFGPCLLSEISSYKAIHNRYSDEMDWNNKASPLHY